MSSTTTTTRRFGNDPPEEKKVLQAIDGFNIEQVRDVRDFWRIECRCSQFHKARQGLAKWCDHAQALLKNHQDVQGERILDPRVRVTVIINPGLEAYFELEDPDENGFRTVYLVVPDETSPAASTRFFQKKPMGLIHAGSGRLELRTLVLEWLIGLTTDGMACRAGHHLVDTSPYERQDDYITSRGNPGFAVLVDMFDLYTTGNCRACNEGSEVDL